MRAEPAKPGRALFRHDVVTRLAAARASVPVAPGPRPVVRLAVLPVSDLADVDDRFRCEPYAAIIRAAVCLERQREQGLMQTHFRIGSQLRERAAGGIHAYVSKCRDCELGRAVAARVGEDGPSS